MRGPAARIIEDANDWQRNTVRLMVRDGSDGFLMADGTWHRFEDGTLTDGAGLVLPSAVIEAIAVAIQEWQGHTSHADTEARILREWLAVEQRRVDRILNPDPPA